MLENLVKMMFAGSCLLLATIVVRKDLFLDPNALEKRKGESKMFVYHSNTSEVIEHSDIISGTEETFKLELQNSIVNWDPTLINFLVNGRSVNVAVASTDNVYLQLKALEFCTENAGFLSLRSLEELQASCADPIFGVLKLKVQDGDFLRPVAHTVTEEVVEASNNQVEEKINEDVAETVVEPVSSAAASVSDEAEVVAVAITTEVVNNEVVEDDKAHFVAHNEDTEDNTTTSVLASQMSENAPVVATGRVSEVSIEAVDSSIIVEEVSAAPVSPLEVDDWVVIHTDTEAESLAADGPEGLKLQVEDEEKLQVDNNSE